MKQKEEIYQRCNLAWYADTFIFKYLQIDDIMTTVYVKINHKNKIEEIGTDVAGRMHCDRSSFEELKKLKYTEPATKLQKNIINRIGKEYWCSLRHREIRDEKKNS